MIITALTIVGTGVGLILHSFEGKYIDHVFDKWYTSPIIDLKVYDAAALKSDYDGLTYCPDGSEKVGEAYHWGFKDTCICHDAKGVR